MRNASVILGDAITDAQLRNQEACALTNLLETVTSGYSVNIIDEQETNAALRALRRTIEEVGTLLGKAEAAHVEARKTETAESTNRKSQTMTAKMEGRSMTEAKTVALDDLNHYMEGRTVAGVSFSNGGGILPTAAAKGQTHYDPRQDFDRMTITLRDQSGALSQVTVFLADNIDGRPYFEAAIEDRPEYFDRE